MNNLLRVALALAALSVAASVTGCSSASDPIDPTLWRQVDAAESIVHRVVTSAATGAPEPDALLDQLHSVATHWDGESGAPAFSEDDGTPVFYNYQTDASGERASFDLMVASGIDEHFSVQGWSDSRPSRVYTCYRIEVTSGGGALLDFQRSRDYGDDQLVCPNDLVSALGEGAQYREPWMFDG